MRRRLSDRHEEWLVRASLGIFSVAAFILGLLAFTRQHTRYPDGDIRNEPLYWIITGMVLLLLAGYTILAVFFPRLRGRGRK